jgi:hypothetical protein
MVDIYVSYNVVIVFDMQSFIICSLHFEIAEV